MLKRGAVFYNRADLTVPLKPGDLVPCPRCDLKHFVQRDSRPGHGFSTEHGVLPEVVNTVLFLECPQEPGPIVVGMDGFALREPIALTPRKEPA